MSIPNRRSGGIVSGSSQGGGGGGSSGSSRGNSNGNSTYGGVAPISHQQADTYDPSRDTTYIQAHRSSRPDQSYLNGVINQASNAVPIQPHPHNQAPRSYHGPHHSWTDHSSSHLRISPYDPSGSDFNSSQVFQATSPAGVFAQPRQTSAGRVVPHQTAPRRSDPYDAVGYVRRDREV